MAKKSVEQAGMSLRSGGDVNPNPIRHGGMGSAERAFSATSTFLSGIMAISASQFMGAPLKYIDTKLYEAHMAWTKESFAVLMTTITQWWAPTVVKVSGDESMKDQLFVMDDGTLKCNFPHRLILMGNHQLYTDWLYLWWIAYTNKMHGRIYIILKESLKRVPIIGWGMQFYNFIFLSRKWEQDRYSLKRHLDHLKSPDDPMWLLIFPEGTNLSAVTREKSAKWAVKTGVPDMKHQLLPRSTGLQFCLREMKPSTNWLYDCTIAYEGVPPGMYGQDIFTLKSSFFEGRPPKSVNLYWRRFRISDIPYEDDEQFSRWLLNRWREKDYMLEHFYKFGSFSAEDPSKAMLAAQGKRKAVYAKAISTSVKGGGWDEFLSIFGPITTTAGALSSLDLTEPLDFDEMMRKVAHTQRPDLLADQQKLRPMNAISNLPPAASQTQAQKKDALLSTRSAQMAQIARRTSAVGKARSDIAKTHSARAAAQSSKHASGVRTSGPRSTPAEKIRRDVPLVNMESMITRPISTVAVHLAGQKVRDLATRRAQIEGTVPISVKQVATKPPHVAAKQFVVASRVPLTAKALTSVPKPASTIAVPPSLSSVKATSTKSAPAGSLMRPTLSATGKSNLDKVVGSGAHRNVNGKPV